MVGVSWDVVLIISFIFAHHEWHLNSSHLKLPAFRSWRADINRKTLNEKWWWRSKLFNRNQEFQLIDIICTINFLLLMMQIKGQFKSVLLTMRLTIVQGMKCSVLLLVIFLVWSEPAVSIHFNVLCWTFYCFFHCQRLGYEFIPQKWEDCNLNTSVETHIEIPKTYINKVTMLGYITVLQEVIGEIDLIFEANKCTLDMKKCEKYSNRTFKDMCKKLEQKNAFFSSAISSIEPSLQCPIQPGNYTLNSTFDLSPFSILPLGDYLWVMTFKLISSKNGTKRKKISFCVISEVTILKAGRIS